MNKFIFWSVAFVLVVGAWFAGRYSVGSPEVIEPTFAGEQVTTNDSKQARLQLEEKIDELEKSISALKRAKAENDVVRPERGAESGNLMPSNVEPVSMVNSSAVVSNRLAGTPIDTNKVTSLPERFASEAVDSNWAPEQEQKLQNQLLTTEAFQKLELGVVECKTTTCRIEFKAESKKQQLDLGAKLVQFMIQKQQGVFDPDVMTRPSETAGITNFYVGRSETAITP